MTSIISFYEGGTDIQGRSLDDMLAFTDGQFEACHDFIQWMFPLHEKSLHSVNTPVLTPEDIAALRSSKIATANMKKAFRRFRDFLGVDGDEKKYSRWCYAGNHNLLRITRVIRSLRLFGLDNEAANFHASVKEAARRFTLAPTAVEFWDKAMYDNVEQTMTDKFLKMKAIRI